MVLISEGIEQVRAFALPESVDESGTVFGEPLSVLVNWESSHFDKLHQVYVDGVFCGFTEDISDRQAVVNFGISFRSAACIEVFAVVPEMAHIDHSDELESLSSGGQVRIRWVPGAGTVRFGTVSIFSNGGSGEIDFGEPVGEVCLSPGNWQYGWGFGLSCFGRSDFGFDGAGAVGFGAGVFGGGEFGFDAEEVEWVSGELAAGEYLFGLKCLDMYGDGEENYFEVGPVTVLPGAKGAEGLKAENYDASAGRLVLSF